MKRMFFIFAIMFSFMMTSCETSAQIAFAANDLCYYYDYGTNLPIIYIDAIPYYRLWIDNCWVNRPVPHERFSFIHRYERPIHMMPPHDMRIGNRYMMERRPMMDNRMRDNRQPHDSRPMFNNSSSRGGFNQQPQMNMNRGGGFQSRQMQSMPQRGGRR